MDELIDLITSTLEPETWDDVGGPGSIRYEPETMSLLIRQTEAVHDEIEETLTTLRKLKCRLPELLRAAGAPTAEEIRRIEVSREHVDQQLAAMDAEMRQLEGIDPGKPPARGLGFGFFQLVVDADARTATSSDTAAVDFWYSISSSARNLARRALRLALRYEQLVEDAGHQ